MLKVYVFLREHLHLKKTLHLIHSHIDYCNALLIGLPKCLIQKLQIVQNTAARVLCRISKYNHITSTLKSLHWLPVEFRIKYKICLLTFNSLHGHGPAYIHAGSEIKDRPLVRDYQIVPRTSKYYNSVVRWTTEFVRIFSGTTWCYKS